MRFCRDCKHRGVRGGASICQRIEAMGKCPFYGDWRWVRPTMLMRGDDEPCGPDAKLFEPREGA